MSFSSISSAASACAGSPPRPRSGQSAIVVWLLAWCGFFLPLAGCVLELSSRYPQEGGLYVWTREAYGEFAAFMAAWTYWMSNLPYFAAVLYFAASSLLFASSSWSAPGRHQHLFPAFYRRHAGADYRAQRTRTQPWQVAQ